MLDKRIICDKCRVALQEYRARREPAQRIYQSAIAGAYEKFRSIVGVCGCGALCERCSSAKEEYDGAIRLPAEIFCSATDAAWEKLCETRGKCCGITALDILLED